MARAAQFCVSLLKTVALTITNSRLLLSAQRALLGAVPSSLRGASIEAQGDTILWQCVFEREPTEEEKEMVSIAGTEIIADFPEAKKIEGKLLVQPSPLEIPHLVNIVFQRFEAK